MPAWVDQGFTTYQRRLPANFTLKLHEVVAKKRSKSADIQKIIDDEQSAIDKVLPTGDIVIALDRIGKNIDTKKLADHLSQWHDQSQNISIIIGGPEGLSADWLRKAHQCWSLSALTLPHPMVRILVAEQIYRAWSIINNHPYHR